jgi:hypothetical protein
VSETAFAPDPRVAPHFAAPTTHSRYRKYPAERTPWGWRIPFVIYEVEYDEEQWNADLRGKPWPVGTCTLATLDGYTAIMRIYEGE